MLQTYGRGGLGVSRWAASVVGRKLRNAKEPRDPSGAPSTGRQLRLICTSRSLASLRPVGVAAIGVAWGYHDANELYAEGADRVALHPQDLTAILKEFR